MDIRETELTPLVAEGQLFMVHPKEVKNGGIEVVHVDGVLGDIVAEFIGFAVGVARPGSAPGHPDSVCVLVVVTAGLLHILASLGHRGTAELGVPDDEGVFKEAALPEVTDESSDRLVDLLGLVWEVVEDTAVVIPALVKELDKAYAAFDETTGQEAVVGKGRFTGLGSVHLMDAVGLALDVHELRDAGLHAVGHLVLAYTGSDFRVAYIVKGDLVEFLDCVDDLFALGVGDAFGIGEVEDGIPLGAELDSLMDGGKEAAAEGAVAGTEDCAGDQNDEAGQIFVFATEAVADPGADAGPPEPFKAGESEHLGGGVVELVGMQGLQEAEFVGDSLEVREEVGEGKPGLAAVPESILFVFRGAEEGGLFADEGEFGEVKELVRAELPGALLQLGFKVEEIKVGGGSDEVNVDNALGLGRVVKTQLVEGVGCCPGSVLIHQ